MTIFVSDTFTDTDAVFLQNHTPEVGGTWIQRQGATTNQILSNQLKTSSTKLTEIFYTNSSLPPSADYNIDFDWNHVDNSGFVIGVSGRFLDTSNYYYFYKAVQGANQSIFLTKVFNGEFTLLDTHTSDSLASGTQAGKLELSGSNQKGYVGGVEKVTGTDTSLTLSGFAGTYFLNGSSLFRMDNFIATDTATPTSSNASMQPINVWWQRD